MGLDVATYQTGWAVIEAGHGPLVLLNMGKITLSHKKSLMLGQRLFLFGEELRKILSDNNPDQILIEDNFIKFMKTAKALNKFHGVAQAETWKFAGKEVITIPVTKIRQLLNCEGKTGIRLMVNKRFNLSLSLDDEDVSDAIAVAWAGYSRVTKAET
jgi:Holliday junction resolvasome RuvABC endonuclease subunit